MGGGIRGRAGVVAGTGDWCMVYGGVDGFGRFVWGGWFVVSWE